MSDGSGGPAPARGKDGREILARYRSGIKRRLAALAGRAAERRLSPLARQVRAQNLTYLSPRKMRVLEATLEAVRGAAVPGDFMEFGVALGGSAVVIASRLGAHSRFHGYDVFGMIPPPGPEDDERSHLRFRKIADGSSAGIGDDTYYGYMPDLYDRVVETFRRFGLHVDGERIALHRGLFEDTFDAGSTRPVAFAHIDCDWYDPVRFCLEAIRPRLVPGARIVLDDYNDYGGCRRAVDRFMAEDDGLVFERTAPNAVVRVLGTAGMTPANGLRLPTGGK